MKLKDLIKEDKHKIYIKKGEQAPEGKKLKTGPRGGQFFIGTAQEKEKYSKSKKTTSIKKEPENNIEKSDDKNKILNNFFSRENIDNYNATKISEPLKKMDDRIKGVGYYQGNDFTIKTYPNNNKSNENMEEELTNMLQKIGLDKNIVKFDKKNYYGSDPEDRDWHYTFKILKDDEKQKNKKTKKNKPETINKAHDKLGDLYNKNENFFKKLAKRAIKNDDNQDFFETLGTWMDEKREDIETNLNAKLEENEWEDIKQQLTDKIAEDDSLWESKIYLKSLIKEDTDELSDEEMQKVKFEAFDVYSQYGNTTKGFQELKNRLKKYGLKDSEIKQELQYAEDED